LVIDGSEPLRSEDYEALHLIPDEIPKIAVINKSDLPSALKENELSKLETEYCNVSALTGEGLDLLQKLVCKKFPMFKAKPTGELITNVRQADAILRAKDSIKAAITSLTEFVTPDAVLTDVEVAAAAIGEVTGKTMREDIISRIFERFCVGK